MATNVLRQWYKNYRETSACSTYPGTVLLVTHRPERLLSVDVIWHLSAGHLIETGSPNVLLQRNGPTADLFRAVIESRL